MTTANPSPLPPEPLVTKRDAAHLGYPSSEYAAVLGAAGATRAPLEGAHAGSG
jgi:hypothetical protein